MHGRRCSPITQAVIADRPKFLTCFGIIAVKGIPLCTGNQQVVTQSQRARSPFSLSPASFFQSCLPRSGFKSTKPLSGSRIDHSFTGHQSVNKGRQAIYGQLLFPTQFAGFGINGIQKALGILGKHDVTINRNGVFNRINEQDNSKELYRPSHSKHTHGLHLSDPHPQRQQLLFPCVSVEKSYKD